MQDDLQVLDSKGHRILAAIVVTDAVNLDAQMSKDESHTLALISRDISLMTEICQQFEGEVLKSTDDGLLMYFVSAVQAVACALEIQQILAASAVNLPPQEVLQHRIGIHLGDVVFADSDVTGNGVDVAAQLQAVAEPGGICVSQTVYDAVKHALALQASYLGPKKLKNIAEIVPAYRVVLHSTPSGEVAQESGVEARIRLTREEYCDRQLLLNKVKKYWIKGVLETSLHNRALIALGLQEQPDAVLPWSLIWETSDSSLQTLPPDTKIIDKFNQLGTGRSLLILGEPGAGKTTTLLELARDLLVRAEHDYIQPMPVVLNLSSWNNEKQSIVDWLVQELYSHYQVAKDISINWLQNQQLLLMLDGLDEVINILREGCVEALNQFSQEYPQTTLVVTSRIEDYEALSSRLKLQGAVCLQPLSLEQIHQYLNDAGPELAAVNRAILEDVALQELARSPLMLSIITLAYQDKSVDELLDLYSLEERRQHLLNAYIERMFKRRSCNKYSKAKAMHWLIWLAQQMSQKSQSVFLIECLQTSWLQNIWQKVLYAIAIASISGLIFGLSGGLNVGMIAGWEIGQIAGLILALVAGVIAALIYGFIYDQINPVTNLKWSWKQAKDSLPQGIIVGLIFGLILGVLGAVFSRQILVLGDRLIEGLTSGWRVGVGVALTFVLLRGLTDPKIETRTIPNQGIWQSAKNAMIFFLLGAIGLGVVAFILHLPILVGAIAGLLFGIFGAGEACIKHIALRLVLYSNRYIPWNYARFLDWATEHIFMQKVGGGYIFIHRLLLEHFAQMALK